MLKLKDMPEFSDETTSLLEAVGYLTAENLSPADPKQIHKELIDANKLLHFSEEIPKEKTISEWIDIASQKLNLAPKEERQELDFENGQTIIAKKAEPLEEQRLSPEDNFKKNKSLINFEKDENVCKMLEHSPEALLISKSSLHRYQVDIAEIPEAILLTQCPKEININVLKSDELLKKSIDKEKKRKEFNLGNIRTIEEVKENPPLIAPINRSASKNKSKP